MPPTFILSQNQTLQFFGSSPVRCFRFAREHDVCTPCTLIFLETSKRPDLTIKHLLQPQSQHEKIRVLLWLVPVTIARRPKPKRDQLPNCQRTTPLLKTFAGPRRGKGNLSSGSVAVKWAAVSLRIIEFLCGYSLAMSTLSRCFLTVQVPKTLGLFFCVQNHRYIQAVLFSLDRNEHLIARIFRFYGR